MRALWRRLVAFLNWLVPDDERLEADTPELRAFYNRMEQTRATRSQANRTPLSHNRTQS